MLHGTVPTVVKQHSVCTLEYILSPVTLYTDLGDNTNLIIEYDEADSKLKDDDDTTCTPISDFTIDFADLNACPEGLCRVNYLLLYFQGESTAGTAVQSISVTDPSGTVTLISADTDLVVDGDNITIPENILLKSLTIQFDGAQDVCEIIVAGTAIGDYECTVGYSFSEEASQCLPCGPGTYSSEAGSTMCNSCPTNEYSDNKPENTECTKCDYLTYSTDGSSVCIPCTKESSSKNNRCYNNTGYKYNVIDVDSSPSNEDIASYDPADSAPVTLNAGTTEITLTGPMHVSSVVIMSDESGLAGKVSQPCTSSSDYDDDPTVLVGTCQEFMIANGEVNAISLEVSETVTITKLFVFGIAFEQAEAPPGYYNAGSSFGICVAGTFSKGGNVSECTRCLKNQYQKREGKTSCENCESGFYSSRGAAECTVCTSKHDSTACDNLDNSCNEASENNAIYGNYAYDWPVAYKNTNVTLPCQYNVDKSASKFCKLTGDKAQYEATDFSECKTKVTDEINDISEQDVTENNQIEISANIKDITETNSGVMNADNVEKTSEIIDNLVEFGDEVLATEVKMNILKTVNSIHKDTKADEIAQGEAASKMRESVKKFSDKMAGEDGYIKESNVAVAIKKPSPGKSTSFSIIGESTDFKETTLNASASSSSESFIFSASVPNDENGKDLTAVFYESSKFYPDNTSVEDVGTAMREQFSTGNKDVSKVISIVTEISYADSDKSVSFVDEQKLELKYAVEEEVPELHYKMAYTTTYKCVFYDTETEEWGDSGCQTTTVPGVDGKSTVTCQCDHMTSFAVLMSFSSDYDPIEDYISQILLAMSLGCLLCTIVAYLPAKDLLKTRTVRLNLLLVTSLILAIITFYFMEVVVNNSVTKGSAPTDNDRAPIPCVIVAFFMNYFWLCQMAWMVCEAIVMYRALVSCVVNSHIHRYMLKFNVACWGIPLVFPIIGVAWGTTDFANPKTCFLKAPYGFVTFYGPVLACVAFNIFIFIRIAWSISRNSMGSKVPASDMERRKKQFKFAVTVMSLLGVAWVFGFLLIFEQASMIWCRYIFILFNSTQGISIFVLYVVLNDNLKKVWLKLLGMTDPDKPSHSSVPYSRSKGKTNETSFAPSATKSDKPGSPRSPKMTTTFVSENQGSAPTAPRFHKMTSSIVSPAVPATNTYRHIYDNAWSEDSLDSAGRELNHGKDSNFTAPYRSRPVKPNVRQSTNI